MKKRHVAFWLSAAMLIAMAATPGAWADGEGSVAGVLVPGNADEYTFRSKGGEILFAEIRSDVYQTTGRKGGGHDTGDGTDDGCGVDHSTTTGMDSGGGGCSGDTTDSGGCGGDDTGGPGDLCLQVVDEAWNKLCWAGRPMRPGWQRDPRLACPIPEEWDERVFILRVFQGQCGSTGMPAVSLSEVVEEIPYRLDVKLIKMTEKGSLEQALAPGQNNY